MTRTPPSRVRPARTNSTAITAFTTGHFGPRPRRRRRRRGGRRRASARRPSRPLLRGPRSAPAPAAGRLGHPERLLGRSGGGGSARRWSTGTAFAAHGLHSAVSWCDRRRGKPPTSAVRARCRRTARRCRPADTHPDVAEPSRLHPGGPSLRAWLRVLGRDREPVCGEPIVGVVKKPSSPSSRAIWPPTVPTPPLERETESPAPAETRHRGDDTAGRPAAPAGGGAGLLGRRRSCGLAPAWGELTGRPVDHCCPRRRSWCRPGRGGTAGTRRSSARRRRRPAAPSGSCPRTKSKTGRG